MPRRYRKALTKAQWVAQLEDRIDQWARISRAQMWLQSEMLYYSDDIPDDYEFGPDKLVDFIHRQARRDHSGDTCRPDVTYVDFLTEYGSIATEAHAFATDLVEICRHIGGDEVADSVSRLVFADHAAVWRYTLDFLADVFTPLYPLIQQALRNKDGIVFCLDDVKVTAIPLTMGRAFLSISREWTDRDGRQTACIGLSGGSLKPDGSGLGLTGAYGPSLGDVLQTLTIATRAFRTLDEDEWRQLFARYLSKAESQPVG